MYKTKKRFPQCLKRSCLALLLLVLFGGYIVGGGYLFSYLERNYEEEYNSKIDKWKNDTAILLATELRQVRPYEDIWARKVFHHLEIFERDLLKAKALGYRRKGNGDRGQRWSLMNAMFFSISLVTATGYGSMTPRSEWSRTAVVCYSLVGIPFTLLCLASVGFLLASYWSWCFHHICCQFCSASSSSELSRPQSKELTKFPRVRSNSIAPIQSEADTLIASKVISSTNKKVKSHTTDLDSFISEQKQDQILNNYANRRKSNRVHIVEVNYNDFLDAERRLSSMDHAVAIVFSVILFAVYFVFGSVTFAVTENWDISDGLYFSYLMFATLGPGCHETEDDSSEIRLKSSSYFAFLTMGYFIISMILNLIYSFCCSTKSDYCHTIYNSKFGYNCGKRNVKY